jgi:hypothetical protein
MDRTEVFGRVEPALSWAREAAVAHDEARAREAVWACVQYLTLYRKARYIEYQPALALEPVYETLERRENVETAFETVPACVGDPEQVAVAAQAFLQGISLEGDARLVVELFHEDDATHLAVNLDGPGRFHDDIWLGDRVRIARDELAERWTYATRGGRIDSIPNGFTLRITGQRKPPGPVEDIEPLIHLLQSPAKLGELLTTAVRVIDGANNERSPGDVKALVESVIADEQAMLSAQRLEVKTMFEPDLPPVRMRRPRLRAFFQSLLRWACASLSGGGTIAILCDYDRGARVMGIVATIAGKDATFPDRGYAASLRRAVVEDHGGTVEVEPNECELLIAATLPDPVGIELDRWIPGFEVFSARSEQMLRLLKSGGQAPPEAFLLAGVLEDELERWLLPKFAEPLAVNVAREIEPKNARQPGSSVERLKKALQQVEKGKVKKEIAQPQYAAELLWACRDDARRRRAFGAERLQPEEIETLAGHLWATPPRYIDALRIIASARVQSD